MKTPDQLYTYCTDLQYGNTRARNWVYSVEEEVWKACKANAAYCKGGQVFQNFNFLPDTWVMELYLLLTGKCGEQVNLNDMYPLCDRIFQDIAARITQKFGLEVPSQIYRYVLRVNPRREVAWYLGPYDRAQTFSELFMTQGYDKAAAAIRV